MSFPATTITTGVSAVQRSRPSDTGIALIAGISATGPVKLLSSADVLRSHAQWLKVYGGGTVTDGRLAYSVDFDWVDTYFRNGGAQLHYARVVGPSPVKSTINLAGTGTTLVVTANEYGAFYDRYKVQVTNGGSGSTRIVKLLQNDGTTLIAQTDEFSDRTLVNGVVLGGLVTITLGGGSGLPTVAAATALAGGTDDHTNITQTQINAALAQLNPDLGPGNVAAPNWQTDAVHDALDEHAATYERFAVPDPTNTTSKSTLVAAGTHRQAGSNGSYGALYAPWISVPSLSSSAGATPRLVPPSALVCARMAATDAQVSPAQSPAGPSWGQALYATGVAAEFSRVPQGTSDADELSEAGVNLIVVENGAVTIFDNLTGVDDQVDEEFAQVGVARWRMQTVALVRAALASEQFARINLETLTRAKSICDGILLRQYERGDLFGDPADDRPETAFNVNTDFGDDDSGAPNTPSTVNAGEINLNLAARPVKGGRFLNVTITAVPITAPVA